MLRETGSMIICDKQWGNITSSSYCEHIIPVIDEYLKQHSELLYQEDNAPPDAAKRTVSEFARRGIIRMVWPPSSPDLNPIEGIWFITKERISSMVNPPRTESEMKETLWAQWEALMMEDILKLIDSMPDHIWAVIAAEGSHTEY